MASAYRTELAWLNAHQLKGSEKLTQAAICLKSEVSEAVAKQIANEKTLLKNAHDLLSVVLHGGAENLQKMLTAFRNNAEPGCQSTRKSKILEHTRKVATSSFLGISFLPCLFFVGSPPSPCSRNLCHGLTPACPGPGATPAATTTAAAGSSGPVVTSDASSSVVDASALGKRPPVQNWQNLVTVGKFETDLGAVYNCIDRDTVAQFHDQQVTKKDAIKELIVLTLDTATCV